MRPLLIIAIVFNFFNVFSQDFHFSQFYNTTFFLNPATSSFQEREFKINAHRKSQWKSVAYPFKTTNISLEKKFFPNKYVAGLQFVNDVSGNNTLKINGLNILYAKNINIEKQEKFFSLGFLFGLFQKSLNTQDLIFTSPENYQNTDIIFSDFSFGFAYLHTLNNKNKIISGVSFNHLNRPNQSLENNKSVRLNQKQNLHAELKHQYSEKIIFAPKIYYSQQSKEKNIIFGSSFDYKLKSQKKTITSAGLFYRNEDALIVNFGVELENLQTHLSYDINISSLNIASEYKGGLELCIIYTWDNPKRNKINTTQPCPNYL